MAGRGPTMWRRASCCFGNGGDEITEVDIHEDGMPVGIVALKQAFEHLYAVGLRSKDPVGDQLLAMIKARNCVPRSAEERYKTVLSREYAAFCMKMDDSTKG